jgi:hypothetical protein
MFGVLGDVGLAEFARILVYPDFCCFLSEWIDWIARDGASISAILFHFTVELGLCPGRIYVILCDCWCSNPFSTYPNGC